MANYEGGCHCGAVRYTVEIDIERTMECNCSLCSRTGWKLNFVGADAFELTSGADALTDYQFAKKHLHHPFCTTCGIRSFSHGAGPDGNEMYAVNIRCLEGFDASSVPADAYDGAAL